MTNTMTKGFQKTNGQTEYRGGCDHLRFNIKLHRDAHVVTLANFVGKEIGVAPQTTAREAMSRGLIEIAKEANIDLSKVILTANSSEAKEHSDTSYKRKSKSQEKIAG
jgi:hypothetical protein